MATTGIFHYADPLTIGKTKPWGKVDTNAWSFTPATRRRSVINLRDVSESGGFDVDGAGFALYHRPARETTFADDAAVRGGYYSEVAALVRDVLSNPHEPVARVVVFDHTVRQRDHLAPRQPVQSVHVDQTPAAAEARVRRHATTDADTNAGGTDDVDIDALLRGRYQIINVWRPIGHTATDCPLALIDYRTTAPEDLVAVDLLYPESSTGNNSGDGDSQATSKEVRPDPATAMSTAGYRVGGETFTVTPSDRHRFYYVKDMTPDEALLIKCFDSRSERPSGGAPGRPGVSAYTPHTAFDDPATPPGTPGRHSIEVRCLVFYEPLIRT